MSSIYRAITHDISVLVHPQFLDEHSDPAKSEFIWAYFITIENNSADTVQLINRYWKITNGLGSIEEVRGPGVVGEKPVLAPGQSHRYNSFSHLRTPSGFMEGQFEMVIPNENGPHTDSSMEPVSLSSFWINIPAFSLDSDAGVLN